MRDAHVLVRTLDTLAERWSPPERPREFIILHDLLETRLRETRRRAIQEQDVFSGALDAASRAMRQFQRCKLQRDDWDALADGLIRMYGRCLAASETAVEEPTDENLHRWRKRVKDLLYAAKPLAPVRPWYFRRLERQADELAELLGEDHDLAVLRQWLVTGQPAVECAEVIVPVLDQRRHLLQGSAFAQGGLMLNECGDGFSNRIHAYWKAWRAEVKAASFDRETLE